MKLIFYFFLIFFIVFNFIFRYSNYKALVFLLYYFKKEENNNGARPRMPVKNIFTQQLAYLRKTKN